VSGAVYCVVIEVAPEAEAAWAAWHADRHMPELLAQPGFRGGRRWRDVERAKDGWARYVAHYDLDAVESLEAYRRSEAGARIKADHEARYGTVTRISRSVLTGAVERSVRKGR
jgi:antibiotic biosynthesis monooxygenase (ABM) superfamily enzyme